MKTRNILYKNIIYKIIFLIVFIFIFSKSLLAETKELDFYNEWYSSDSQYNNSKPFSLIKEQTFFIDFWKKSGFGGSAPYIDFSKFVVLVWAPGYTRRDCSKVNFEKIYYKEGNLLVLVDFADEYIKYGNNRRPIKAIILPLVENSDLFLFKKVKKGGKNYDCIPIFTIWNMDKSRNKELEKASLEGYKEISITLSTVKDYKINLNDTQDTNIENTSKPKPNVKPITVATLPNNKNNESKQNNNSNVKPVNTKPIVNNNVRPSQTSSFKSQSGINFKSNNPNLNISPDPKYKNNNENTNPVTKNETPKKNDFDMLSEPNPDAAPGMDEDPLFGSEFDITF